MNKSIFRMFLLVMAAGIMMISPPSFAYNLTVNHVPGQIYETTALTGYTTLGDMMDGMSVTVFFTDNTSETRLWQDISSQAGGVSGTGWTLNLYGNSYGNEWMLSSSKNISGLSIDAGTGDTVFDNTRFVEYTPGSADGWTFEVANDPMSLSYLNITATYEDLVALKGSVPQGDLYRTLSIMFDNQGGLAAGDTLRFIADTDNLKIQGDIQPQGTPEPSTLLLLGSGLIGIVGVRKRLLRK